ncbi:multimerin-2a isoform X2 [Boleophthalmus pectinirostris]|uniref:multimerin-2a isoform X2 n=1 Tax=Boleophthalmus pectinirostris TaxID=150288 RepID=UPI002432214E|nr:multimerin-2a isoform X2 [Boleophthalmus pectinirostris]
MRQVLLLLGLLLSAHSELRARDPEVEQEDGGLEAADPRGGSGLKDNVPHGGAPQGNVPARSGNWCAVVQKRVVTGRVRNGTEQYTIKSQSPCPSGVPDCQLVMYKLSMRPLYRQTLREVTALLWQCCPGYTGPNCDHSVSGAQVNPTFSGHSEDSPNGPGSEEMVHMDPHQEQNDHQGLSYHTSQPNRPSHDAHESSNHTYEPEAPAQLLDSVRQDYIQNTQHRLLPDTIHSEPMYKTPAQHIMGSQDPNLHSPRDRRDPVALRYQDTPTVLPVPHMMALVMSQLQPILEAFNRSLMHMQSQLGALTHEVAELKGLSPPDLQASSLSRDGLEEKDKLEQVYQELRETQDQVQQQRNLLESHHALLLSNLTRLRTDMNVNVQAINRSLSELMQDHKQPSSELVLDSETSALWSAVERLDNRVVNNTVQVQTLLEDVEVVSGNVQQLHELYRDQDKRINATSRRSQVQFMETGLEVEAAKVVVLQRVEELAGNLSVQGLRLTDLDVDVDYLFNNLYRTEQNSSIGDCGCSELRTAVTHIQKALTNVTEQAKENRLTLEALEESEGQGETWGDSDWQPVVEALHQGLQQLKSSWALEENRTRRVEHSVADLSWSLQQWQAQVTELQHTEAQRTLDNQHLRESFNSLLQDAIRHSDVLELLLGEEVLEFLDLPIHDQKAYSIPSLKKHLIQHEEQLSVHNHSIAHLTKQSTEVEDEEEEVPAADQPSSHPHALTDWLTSDDNISGRRGPAREHHSLLRPQLIDGSDLWKLEQAVEKLEHRVESIEQKQNSSKQKDPRLQDEVMWLKRGLEEHLKVFKNIFSNTDKLTTSKQPLELDKVLELVKSRQRRKGGSGNAH